MSIIARQLAQARVERDHARDLAVALEQQLDLLRAHAELWLGIGIVHHACGSTILEVMAGDQR